MKKRTLSLLLAALMLALCMLSSCGEAEKLPDPDLDLNDSPKNEITVTAAQSSAKKYGEVELFALE